MMRNERFIFRVFRRSFPVVIFVLFLILFSGNAPVLAASDFQYWNTEAAEWKFHEDFKLTTEGEFRFQANGRGFMYQHTDAGLVYSGIGKWLDLGLNYRLIFGKKLNRDWIHENVFHMNATLKQELFGFDLSSRSRFECIWRQSAPDGWRYRNKFAVKAPWKITRFKLQPYIANEIFVDFYKGEFDRNRLYGGFFVSFFKNLKGDIYYMWQTTKNRKSWYNTNVFGTNIKLVF